MAIAITVDEGYIPKPLPYRSAWIKALRSGEFNQAPGALRSADGHCCLGVLLEVQKRMHDSGECLLSVYSPELALEYDVALHAVNPCYRYLDSAGYIPAGVTVTNPQWNGGAKIRALTTANDIAGVSFDEIADIIEVAFVDLEVSV